MVAPEFLHELFEYRDGSLYWKVRPEAHFPSEHYQTVFNKRFATKVAGHVSRQGYIYIRVVVDGRRYSLAAHRIVWAMHTGAWPEEATDHIDHNRSNNRIENLRAASPQQNSRNASRSRRNSSGVTGVTWVSQRGRWMAFITVDGRLKNLGHYSTFDEAVEVRRRAEVSIGFHDNHGRAA